MKSVPVFDPALCFSMVLARRYPNRAELARWAGIASTPEAKAQRACCSSGSRC